MPQTLLTTSEVFAKTWHEGKTHLGADLKDSMWFLGIALASFLLAIAGFYLPSVPRFALHVLDLIVLQIIGNTWVTLKLSARVLAEQQEKKLQPVNLAMLGSFLLISILSGLATVGGTIAFVLPGIWLTIAFAFAVYVFLDENRRGREALARSAELVKGRWWSVLGRLILPGFVILVVSMLASSIIESLVGLIAGYRPSMLITNTTNLSWLAVGPPSTNIASAALAVINTLPLIIAIPFLTHLTVTIYLDLKRTR